MTANTQVRNWWNPANYVAGLRRCGCESKSQIENALKVDLNIEELRALCAYLHTSAAGITEAVARELGI